MFEWDIAKNQSNIRKHGLSFERAIQVFDGRPELTYLSPFMDEERFVTIAQIGYKLWVVVWTKRGDAKRIISAYRADEADERKYRSVFGG